MNYTCKMFDDPNFDGEDIVDPETARRAKVVMEWLDNILSGDVRGNARTMLFETRDRIKKHGENTTFSEKQFYYLRGIYERATGEECHEKY